MAVALHRQIETLRPALLRLAILQLRNEALAENVVQEALIAILEKPERFAEQSSLHIIYVTGIKKLKIVDALRASKR
jgi:RNA polymerase sigma-70 factor, ECF subfamily